MQYRPYSYEKINLAAGCYNPSMVKSVNNKTFAFWERALFQRACSVLDINLPDEWSKCSIKDFFMFCLSRYGNLTVFKTLDLGTVFFPGKLSGYNFFMQPTKSIVTNLALDKSLSLEIGKDCEILKLTPDYMGIWDIIWYYAEKLSVLDSAINMSLINNKYAFILAARNKAAAEALKKVLDKVNKGEPAVITDMSLKNDQSDKAEPWQFLERGNLKSSYLTTEQLADFDTLLKNFDTEIGIPTISEKKERLVTSEAETKIIDSTSRSSIWVDTFNDSAKAVNEMFDLNISAKLRFNEQAEQEDDDVKDNIDRNA